MSDGNKGWVREFREFAEDEPGCYLIVFAIPFVVGLLVGLGFLIYKIVELVVTKGTI